MTTMKCLLVTTLIALCSLGAHAQEVSRNYARSLKVYNLSDFEYYEDTWSLRGTLHYTSSAYTLRLLQPTVAYQWRSAGGKLHELELISLRASRSEELMDVLGPNTGSSAVVTSSEFLTSLALAFRYEYIFLSKQSENRNWDLYLGASINPYYFHEFRTSQLTTIFPSSIATFGARVHAVPRIVWHLSSRVYLDLNIPLCLAELRHLHRSDDNPRLRIDERRVGSTELATLPPFFSARLGLGFKLYE